MKKNVLPMPLIVGLFMVAGVFTMIAMTLAINGQSSPFSHGTEYHARFATVEGLSAGSYVYLAGKKVGSVTDVEVDQVQGDALVTFVLDQPYLFHSKDRLVIVQVSPITDSKRMDIVHVPGDVAAWSVQDEIKGQPVESVDFHALTQAITDTANKLNTKLDKLDVDAINGTFQSGQKVLGEIDSGEGNLGKSVKNFEAFTEELSSKDGVVNAALTGKEWKAQIDKSLANVTQFTTDLNNPDGFLHKALTDKKFSDDLTGTVADLKIFASTSLNNENGMVHTLFNDKQFADDVKKTVGDVKAAAGDFRAFGSKLNDPDGMLNRVLTDKTWADKTDATLTNAASLTANLNKASGMLVNGQGTLGKLLTDDSLYNSVEGLVGEVRRAVDDAREFTPVSSALSALIGVAR